MNSLMEVLKAFDGLKNKTIIDNIIKAWSKINSPLYNNIGCSISGGSDSDIMLDIVTKCDKDKKVKYFWFDTGLEYQATKDHLEYLEKRYNIKIERERAVKPIPISCKENGEPFISKAVSEFMQRLQSHNFKWEDKPYNELIKEYPKCKSALKWWCNGKTKNDGYNTSAFDINRNKFLKEFLISNPPTFKISNKCCNYAKKDVSKKLIKKYNLDLIIIGVRKAEGGARATAYKSCFSENTKTGADEYRPLFWYSHQDKIEYENNQNIIHSDCYKKYGFRRTGCACCPYGHINKGLENELKTVEIFEPKLYKAVNNIFKNSYEYTKKYYEFRAVMEAKEQIKKEELEGQMSIYDLF